MIRTFDMYGVEAIHCEGHKHKKQDKCHRCDSINTEIGSDCVTGLMYWIYLACNDCHLHMLFGGGSEL